MREIILYDQKSEALKGDYTGEFTKEFDKFLLGPSYSFKYTYINKFDKDTLVFRVPGATRGCIKIDENGIIEEIHFYNDTCFNVLNIYDKSIVEYMNKYVGYKITLLP